MWWQLFLNIHNYHCLNHDETTCWCNRATQGTTDPLRFARKYGTHKSDDNSFYRLNWPSHLSTATKMFEHPFQSLVNGIPRKCGNPRRIGPYHPEQIITQLKCLKSLIWGFPWPMRPHGSPPNEPQPIWDVFALPLSETDSKQPQHPPPEQEKANASSSQMNSCQIIATSRKDRTIGKDHGVWWIYLPYHPGNTTFYLFWACYNDL